MNHCYQIVNVKTFISQKLPILIKHRQIQALLQTSIPTFAGHQTTTDAAFYCFYCIATRCCRPSSSSITLDFTEDTLGAKMVFICPEIRASAPALKSSSCHRRTPPMHSADTTLPLALLQLPASHAPLLSTSLPLVMSECLNLWKRKHAICYNQESISRNL